MHIEYLVTLDCAPKRAVGDAFRPMLRRKDPALAVHAAHCQECPATSHGAPFGCWGRISFPIRASTEEWLTDQLDGDGDGVGISSLRSVLESLRISGAPVAELRARGRDYFDDDEGVDCEWELESGETSVVSADQLWHLLSFSGPMPPSNALLLALTFGILSGDTDPEELMKAMDDVGTRRRLLRKAAPWTPPATPQIAELHAFFRAMVHALWVDLPLVVSAKGLS